MLFYNTSLHFLCFSVFLSSFLLNTITQFCSSLCTMVWMKIIQ
uniref:Uncharacterized protein n=1 Tax=Picea sitchensis TaxID=3332 RepID=D5A964_PICSI|nr:unknown [Picea sitchensis]